MLRNNFQVFGALISIHCHWHNCYRPQRSWGKVMFLQVCVILFTGGVPDQVPPDQVHPPGTRYIPPRTRYTPLAPGAPPGTRYTPRDQVNPPGPGRYGYVRAVRILLECILVFICFFVSQCIVDLLHVTFSSIVDLASHQSRTFSNAVCCSSLPTNTISQIKEEYHFRFGKLVDGS